MLTEDLQPWLIEINSSPSMARNTHATMQLVDNVLEDTLKGSNRLHQNMYVCIYSSLAIIFHNLTKTVTIG